MTMVQANKQRRRPQKQGSTKAKKVGTASRRPTKRVYICSPLKGNIEQNMRNAEAYCRFAFKSGFVPIAPHIYYPRFLHDTDEFERAAGRRYGLEEFWRCNQLWVFGDERSEGMKAEIELASILEIPIRYFTNNLEEKEANGKHI